MSSGTDISVRVGGWGGVAGGRVQGPKFKVQSSLERGELLSKILLGSNGGRMKVKGNGDVRRSYLVNGG